MKYIDLTMTYQSGMRGVSIEPAKTLQKDGWNASTLQIYSHAGTHMDAPLHFEVSNKSIDQYPVSKFFCNCWLIDLSGCKPSKSIEICDLGEVAEKFAPGEGLLFKTGWSAFEGQDKYRSQLPRISKKLAEWCAANRVAMIGVEPPSVADVNNMAELTEVHTILLQADIVIIEGITNLGAISKPKVQVIALPLKVENGDGAPCRILAIED